MNARILLRYFFELVVDKSILTKCKCKLILGIGYFYEPAKNSFCLNCYKNMR